MTTLPRDLVSGSEALLTACGRHGLRLVTAESCTGGLIAACITAIPGSSTAMERGFVTYSNESKQELLGVSGDLLQRHGAVSEAVARAMAEGAIARSHADIAVAVTGIAGPGGATEEKPVGLVHIAAARRGEATWHERHVFPGDRNDVRHATALAALALLTRRAG